MRAKYKEKRQSNASLILAERPPSDSHRPSSRGKEVQSTVPFPKNHVLLSGIIRAFLFPPEIEYISNDKTVIRHTCLPDPAANTILHIYIYVGMFVVYER
jgi:hypothetical protein